MPRSPAQPTRLTAAERLKRKRSAAEPPPLGSQRLTTSPRVKDRRKAIYSSLRELSRYIAQATFSVAAQFVQEPIRDVKKNRLVVVVHAVRCAIVDFQVLG